MKSRVLAIPISAALALALAGLWPSAVRSQSSATTSSALPLQVRVGNQKLLEQIHQLVEQVRQGTERLTALGVKSDEVRGKSDSLRKEIVDLFRTIHQIRQLGDELLLRGELDGELVRNRAAELKTPLVAAVTGVRANLGNPMGLVNATVRRAKDQLIAVKQVDDLIKQKNWSSANTKLETLIEAADDVGRFPDTKDAELLFKPLEDRLARVRPAYLSEKRPSVATSLREEFAKQRPDLNGMHEKLGSVSAALQENREVRWNNQPIPGPELLNQIATAWQALDRATAQAAAVLHAIGADAESELKSLEADYEAARVQAVTMVRELILAEPQSLAPALIESRTIGYLDAVPRFMTALHATPKDIQGTHLAISQLAGRSPELKLKINRYREATDEPLRWRRRLASRRHKNLTARDPKNRALPITKLLDEPPPLPGQSGPAGLKRATPIGWAFDQLPESVAGVWSEQWKDVPVTVQKPAVRWPAGSNARFISAWHRRVVVEAELSREITAELTSNLNKDLLTGPNRPPLTLETALALHTGGHGPYIEMYGTIDRAIVENLPDRLWDVNEPLDLQGALAAGSLAANPNLPGLVRLQLKPAWIVHELFAWSPALPLPPVSPTPSPAKSAPIATKKTPAQSPPEKAPAAGSKTDEPPLTPSATPPSSAVAGDPAKPATPAKKADPPKSAPPVPKGGVSF